jgi:class 3 adenylate cyclase
MAAETRYAKTGDIHIAYQVVGEGPVDIVLFPEFWHTIEVQWDQPELAAFLERLASFGRLISFDQRGTGLSDPVAIQPALEPWLEDAKVVMNEVDSQSAVLLGFGGGGLISMLFAATHPERTVGLVLVNSFARISRAEDYPWGRGPELEDEVLDVMRTGWGKGVFLDVLAPSRVDDQAFRRWWARYQRIGASPGTIVATRRMLGALDAREILPSIRAPTLVLQSGGNAWVRPEHGRYLTDHIADATYVELPGPDYFVFLRDASAALGEIEQFIEGCVGTPEADRLLATVLFTDIVGSTELVSKVGDRRWTELLDAHHAVVRRELERFRGREVDTAGDGFFATFDGPARGVRCACAIRDAVRELGIEIRAGLHTGEVEAVKEGLAGVAVHIGQRVLSEASPGEVLVSSTVKDLAVGSGLEFEDRGSRALKGVPDEWRLFAVL